MDTSTQKALAIVVDSGTRGEHVVEVVEAAVARRGALGLIRLDNGPEFVPKLPDRWTYERGVTLDFSRPAEPPGNGSAESSQWAAPGRVPGHASDLIAVGRQGQG